MPINLRGRCSLESHVGDLPRSGLDGFVASLPIGMLTAIRSAAIQLPQKYSLTASCITLGPPVPVYVFEYSPK